MLKRLVTSLILSSHVTSYNRYICLSCPHTEMCKDEGDNFPCLQASKITVQVKTPKEKQAVEIEENVTVRKVTRGSSIVSAELSNV